jgi:hypothetical protein
VTALVNTCARRGHCRGFKSDLSNEIVIDKAKITEMAIRRFRRWDGRLCFELETVRIKRQIVEACSRGRSVGSRTGHERDRSRSILDYTSQIYRTQHSNWH